MPAVEARTPSLTAESLPESMAAAQTAPTLRRAVMQPTLLAAGGVLVLALLLGVLNARQETTDEVAGALATARLSRYLGNLPQLNDSQALSVLRHSADLRHLRLRVADGDGNIRIGAELPVSATEHSIAWTVARPEGPPWTVTLVAAPEPGWVAQALAALRALAALALALAVVLAALAWSLARTLAPAGGLLAALRALRSGNPATLRQLPRLPVAELEAGRGDLLQLAATLQEQNQARHRATQQLLSLQENDRGRLARSLADDIGQPLAALRLDTVWLRRQLAANRQFEPVVSGMLARLLDITHGLGRVLAHLNPLPVSSAAAAAVVTADGERPDRLRDLLLTLIDDAPGGAAGTARCSLAFESDAAQLPRPLVLAVYRISQEALRHVAHDAGARAVTLGIGIDGRQGRLHWSISDEGRGLAAGWARGSGLDAIRAQVRAFGGDLSASPGPDGRGLHLSATLTLGW